MLNMIRTAMNKGTPATPSWSMDGNYKSYPFQDCDSLYDVRTVIGGAPDFMVWETANGHPDWVGTDRILNPEYVIGMLRKYAANMSEEELSYFKPVFDQLLVFMDVKEILCHQNGFYIYTKHKDTPVVLRVTVLNMCFGCGIAHFAS